MPRLPDVADLGARPIPISRRRVSSVRNPGALGASIGEVGETLSKAGAATDEADQRRQAAQAGVDFARMAGDVQVKADEYRTSAAPGAAGHVKTVEAYADQQLGAFLEGIKDKGVRQAFEVNAAQLRSRLVTAEDGWELGRRTELATENAVETTRLLSLQLQTRPDPKAFEDYLGVVQSTILGQDSLSADIAAALVRKQQARLARAYVDGLTEKDPEAARAVLDSGALNQWLDEDARRALVDSADGEVRVREADARRVLAAQRGEAQARINLLQKRLADHDPTITPEELESAQTLAAAAQLPLEIYDIGKARVMLDVDRLYRSATAVEISAALRDLNGKIAQEGEKAKPEDVVRRDHLQSLLQGRQQENANDPLTSYSRMGGKVEPVDLGNPASVRNRLTAARAAEKQTGYFQYFTPQEAGLLRENIASGPAGRMEAVNAVAAIGGYDTQAALRIADEIAPNDAAFKQAIRLPLGARGMVVRGVEARKLLPASFERDDGTKTSFNAITQAWFSTYIAPTLRMMQPDFLNGTLEAARNAYAERLRQRGEVGREEFSEADFAGAINLVLGGTGNGGGMGRWEWGPKAADGNSPGILLPSGMSQDEFHKRMTGLPIGRLGEKWPAQSVNGVPTWANGQTASVDDIRKKFVPVAVRDGVYQFHWNGQVLLNDTGGAWELNVRALSPRNVPPAVAAPRRAERAVTPALPAARPATRGPVWVAPPRRQ